MSGQRRGFILVAAIVALVVIALLITGAFFASGQEIQIARGEMRDQQAFAYAEYAVAHAVAAWDAKTSQGMAIGQTLQVGSPADAPLASNVFITRLDSALFVVVAEGRLEAADAYNLRRRVGLLVTTTRGGATVDPPVRVGEQAWIELY
jgi:Tfp pilus assembly protein PilX